MRRAACVLLLLIAAVGCRPTVPSAPGYPPECYGLQVPAEIAWRESRCTRGIDTGNGYYGYAQVARFHWFGGICDGLTWLDPAQEDECVSRLWDEGRGARHWGA